MALPLLEGEVVDDGRDQEVESLKEQIRDLESQLADALAATAREKRNAALAMGNLRRQLSPLYQALRSVFGELDAAGVGDETAPSTDARWESVKKRMPGRPAEFIDLLLVHQPMNVTQFVTLAKCSKQTAYNILSKLGQAGVVTNAGGRYSLRSA